MTDQNAKVSLFGREKEIQIFEDTLRAPDTPYWLLNFYGVKGIGKTALLAYLHESLPPTMGYLYDLMHVEGHVGAFLEELEKELQDFDLPAEEWEKYRAKATEIKRDRDATKDQMRIEMSHVNVTLTQNSSDGATIYDSPQTANILDNAKFDERIQKNEGEYWHKMMLAFLDIAEHLNNRPYILFLDHWEYLEEVMASNGWKNWVLRGLLIGTQQRREKGFAGFRVVIASESRIDDSMLSSGTVAKTAVFHELQPYSEEQALRFLGGKYRNPLVRQKIYEKVRGIPGMLDKILQYVPKDATPTEADRALKDFEREELRKYLKSIEHRYPETVKKLFRYGTVLKSWDRRLLSAACNLPDLNENIFDSLIATPYVAPVSGTSYYQFDTEFRVFALENLWNQYREDFFDTHARAERWYSGQQENT